MLRYLVLQDSSRIPGRKTTEQSYSGASALAKRGRAWSSIPNKIWLRRHGTSVRTDCPGRGK